jgi:methionine synthase II (cobalamin-independent)
MLWTGLPRKTSIYRRKRMPIPTEPVGSLPRPAKLQVAYADYDAGKITKEQLTQEQDAACLDSIKRMEATGSPIVSDGEQRMSSFATYPLTDTLAGTGLADHLAGDGQYFAIFADGHHRQLPRLTGGPFRYKTYAVEFTEKAVKMATKPLKQAVIAPSMLALLYPLDGEVKGYSREQFLGDLCDECEKDIRGPSRPALPVSRSTSRKGGSRAGTTRKIPGPDATCLRASSTSTTG